MPYLPGSDDDAWEEIPDGSWVNKEPKKQPDPIFTPKGVLLVVVFSVIMIGMPLFVPNKPYNTPSPSVVVTPTPTPTPVPSPAPCLLPEPLPAMTQELHNPAKG